jgi:hypothetical protein
VSEDLDSRLYEQWMDTARAEMVRVRERRVLMENEIERIREMYRPEPTEFDEDIAELAKIDGSSNHTTLTSWR